MSPPPERATDGHESPHEGEYESEGSPGGIEHDTLDLYRLLVATVRDYAIFALDPAGHILSWNAGARRIKGYTAEEAIGRHFSIFYPSEDVASRKAERELEIADREGRFEDEGWRVRKDGTRFWANVIITALRDTSGELVGFAKVTRDLTERRAAEQRALADTRRIVAEEAARAAAEERTRALADVLDRLREQTAEVERQREAAEQASRAKNDFMAAMSHELRTPLNAISGYAELMEMGLHGPLTNAQRRDIERIQKSQRHLLSIINDLLNLSRMESGGLTYDIVSMPVQAVIDDIAGMMSAPATRRGITLSSAGIPPGLSVRADQSKLGQILLNLVSNAIKFTPSGGEVVLSAWRAGDRVAIAVRDTGRGIPADALERIFQPFVQLGRSLSNPGEGAGLGLAISHDLARGMNGELLVESRLGAGSTFTVLLPAGAAGAGDGD